ncbi:MAG: hypothetical protein WC479_09740 [Candidatus Izemoplasmatales bacterium]
MLTLTITISATPSLNKMRGRWALTNLKRKYRKEFEGYEVFALKEKKRMKVTVQRFGSRILDLDNYVAGFKVVGDFLTEKGIIVDDSPKWLDLEFLPQVKCKRGEEKTVLIITEAIDGQGAQGTH